MRRSHMNLDKLKAMLTRKRGIFVICAVLILCTIAAGSIAWLSSVTGSVTNKFDPAEVTIIVTEEPFDHEVKQNVSVENTGNVHAYIRVALVPAWVDENGNVVAQEASLDDCTITWGENGTASLEGNPDWFKGSDGYYYCRKPIPPRSETPNNFTPILIKKCEVNDSAYGHQYDFELRVMASAVQAIPTDAVEEAWGVSVDANGDLIMSQPKENQGGN